MKTSPLRSPLWLFLLIVALGTSGFYHVKKSLAKRQVTASQLAFNHQMDDLIIEEYHDNGKIKQSLSAKHLKDLKKGNALLLTNPHIKIHLASGKINSIKAAKGLYIPKEKTIYFKNQVLVEEFQKNENNPLSSLQTESLTFNTQSQLASTKSMVTIIQDNRKIKAQGLSANLKKETLVFPGKTNIHFKI